MRVRRSSALTANDPYTLVVALDDMVSLTRVSPPVHITHTLSLCCFSSSSLSFTYAVYPLSVVSPPPLSPSHTLCTLSLLFLLLSLLHIRCVPSLCCFSSSSLLHIRCVPSLCCFSSSSLSFTYVPYPLSVVFPPPLSFAYAVCSIHYTCRKRLTVSSILMMATPTIT